MEFDTAAQRTCYTQVKVWMQEIFGEVVVVHDDVPVFGIPYGSALVHVVVYPLGKTEAAIQVRAYVVRNVQIVPELAQYLLHQNAQMRFGAFGLDEDNDIFFDYALIGSNCQKEELRAAVSAVMGTADSYDDQIVAKYGGEKALKI